MSGDASFEKGEAFVAELALGPSAGRAAAVAVEGLREDEGVGSGVWASGWEVCGAVRSVRG